MAKAGWAELYDNAGAEYGGLEKELKKAVEVAKYDPLSFCLLILDDSDEVCGYRI
jgi:hypothetical protein